jgi:hypothetical protein
VLYRQLLTVCCAHTERLAFVRGGDGAAFLGHEYAFFFGDLNYRLETTRSYALTLIGKNVRRRRGVGLRCGGACKRWGGGGGKREQDLPALLSRDQLLRTLPVTALRGFREAPITFAPTYKYDRGTQTYDQSEKQRVPAWCDRVLYSGSGARMVSYTRDESTLSDHRPVAALLEVAIKAIDWTRAGAAESAIRLALGVRR